jgi:hypothetical protein
MTSTTPFTEIRALGRPSDDEIELCLFGPGFGESILIHIGDNRWMVVDSCVYDGMSQPIALYYLDQLGLDATVIESVLITHWHSDHSRGASELVRSTPNAKIWIAQTLTTPEFLRFAMRMNKNKTTVAASKLKEFVAIINEIANRREAGLATFGFALQNLPLHQIDGGQLSHGGATKLTALSPSHGDHFDFLNRIAAMLPRAKQAKRSLGGPSPNEISVASLLEIGLNSILLGADLENAKTGSGWDAVLSANRSNRFGMPAQVYKVSHHGSLTAHNPAVWADMLTPDPIAILAPWQKGRGRLPDINGIKTITRLAAERGGKFTRDRLRTPNAAQATIQIIDAENRWPTHCKSCRYRGCIEGPSGIRKISRVLPGRYPVVSITQEMLINPIQSKHISPDLPSGA